MLSRLTNQNQWVSFSFCLISVIDCLQTFNYQEDKNLPIGCILLIMYNSWTTPAVLAVRSLIASFFRLILALISLSWCVRQEGQSHSRRFRFLTSLFWYPQQEHNWLEANVFDTTMTCLPYHFALYSNMDRNCNQDTSLIAFANLWFFNIFDTCKSSIPITSWFLMISVEILSK